MFLAFFYKRGGGADAVVFLLYDEIQKLVFIGREEKIVLQLKLCR